MSFNDTRIFSPFAAVYRRIHLAAFCLLRRAKFGSTDAFSCTSWFSCSYMWLVLGGEETQVVACSALTFSLLIFLISPSFFCRKRLLFYQTEGWTVWLFISCNYPVKNPKWRTTLKIESPSYACSSSRLRCVPLSPLEKAGTVLTPKRKTASWSFQGFINVQKRTLNFLKTIHY